MKPNRLVVFRSKNGDKAQACSEYLNSMNGVYADMELSGGIYSITVAESRVALARAAVERFKEEYP